MIEGIQELLKQKTWSFIVFTSLYVNIPSFIHITFVHSFFKHLLVTYFITLHYYPLGIEKNKEKLLALLVKETQINIIET